ncbi:MAG TPA: ATP-binding protein, partial [Polyangiaceae bacterium]
MRQAPKLRQSFISAPPRVIAGFAIAVLTLVIVSGLTLRVLAQRSLDVKAVEHTFSVLRTVEELADDVNQSQLALTEFIVTGDDQFLQPYERARQSVPTAVIKLRTLTANRPQAQQRVNDLESALASALQRDGEEIEARRAGVPLEQLRSMLMESKSVLDRAGALLHDLRDDRVKQLQGEQAALSESIRSHAFIVVLSDLILLTLILAAATLSMRDAADKARAVQFQRRILGMVGHDLRNPLGAIKLASTQLARTTDVGDRRLTAISRIIKTADRMERMIRDLLDFSRIELRISLPLDIRPSDIDATCTRVIEWFRASHPTREIRYQPGQGSEVSWDSDRVEQVLENLLSNAQKYSPPETPVSLCWRRESGEIVIEVNSRGAPIPHDLLPRIFEPFQRGNDKDVRRAKDSLGLGLYVVRHIVAQHGGKVDARSSESEGTTFMVQLPESFGPATPSYA